MNSWIERNIIFPRINELKKREKKQRQEMNAKAAVLKQFIRRKNSSQHRLEEAQPFTRRQNQSIETRILPLNLKKKKYLHPSIRTEGTQQSEFIKMSERAKIHAFDAELFYDRKNMFHSSPLKNQAKKSNSGREEYWKQQKMEDGDPINNHKKLQKLMFKQRISKSKTNPIEQYLQNTSAEKYDNGCLNIKKAPTFQYNLSQKIQQTEREPKKRRYDKAKCFHPFKESGFKITSVKGWKFQQEELLEYL